MNDIGKRIKEIRTEKRKTISQVSSDYVSPGTISLIENGKIQPSLERLRHIARNLDVDLLDLIGVHTRELLKEEI